MLLTEAKNQELAESLSEDLASFHFGRLIACKKPHFGHMCVRWRHSDCHREPLSAQSEDSLDICGKNNHCALHTHTVYAIRVCPIVSKDIL